MTEDITRKMDEETLKRLRAQTTKLRRRIGRNILQARQEKGMTLKRLAERAALTPENLDKMEMGQGIIELYYLVRIAYLLDKEFIDLLK